MPALPVIADVFRLVFNWAPNAQGGNAKNVLHVYAPDKDPSDVAAIVNSETDDGVFAGLSQLAIVDSFDIQPLDGVSAASVFPATAGWRDGSGGTDYTPQACILVSTRTGLAGRSNHGRVYLPYAAESELLRGELTTMTQETMQGSWEATRDAWGAAGVTWGVASYKGAGAFNPIATLIVEKIVATQRRRVRR